MDSKAIGNTPVAGLRATAGARTDASAPKATADRRSAPALARSDVRLESLSLARDMAAKGPPLDQGKITDVQQRISGGRYNIDPAQIAEAMIRMDLS